MARGGRRGTALERGSGRRTCLDHVHLLRDQKMEIYNSVFLGKGSGSDWDFQWERAVARRLVRADAPVPVEVGANVGD